MVIAARLGLAALRRGGSQDGRAAGACVHRVCVRARVRASSIAQDRGRACVVLVACLALIINACAWR
jgi:hypothetical protein